MPNPYFQFKQFRIEQDKAGMKVTTDGCLFAALIEPDQEGPILDIGTGTGLLSLMLAQRTSAFIDAIEIDAQVATQANENVIASPWLEQIQVHLASLQEYVSDKKYKQIISNPPFFKNNASSSTKQKNFAIHNDLLPMEDLLSRVLLLLDIDGIFWLMYPLYEMGVFISAASNKGLYLQKQVLVRNQSKQTPIRSICCFSKRHIETPIQKEICIRADNQEYTGEFKILLKDFYLHL